MSQIIVTPFSCAPGIQRDGTAFSSKRYIDGCWVRFVNDQPKKIGGFYSYIEPASLESKLSSPFLLQSTGGDNKCMVVIAATSQGIYIAYFLSNDPFISRDKIAYSYVDGDVLREYKKLEFNSGVGSFCNITFAESLYPHWYFLPAFNQQDITSSNVGVLYYIDLKPENAEKFSLLKIVVDYSTKKTIEASGGVWCAQTFPLIIVYGSNGTLMHNDPFYVFQEDQPEQTPLNTWTDKNGNYYTRQIAQCKIVAIHSTMGQGNNECALAWGLFGLYYLSFQPLLDATNNLQPLLQIISTVVSTTCSILGQLTIVEANNMFFWIGLGCFYTYNGTVQELKNDTNKIWFYNNINHKYANISYGVLNTQFSEIWWLFPKEDSTVCNHAIIYNYQTGTWYDTPFMRSAGCPSILNQTTLYTTPVLTPTQIKNAQATQPYLSLAGISSDSFQLMAHEVGVDADILMQTPEGIIRSKQAIVSNFTYNMTSLLTTQNAQNRSILNVMLELDLVLPKYKEMSLVVYTIPYPADWAYGKVSKEPIYGASYMDFYTFNNKRRYIYLQSQGRIITTKFESNTLGGDYWMGTCLWHWQYGSVNPSTPDTIA